MKTLIWKDICTQMFITERFIIAKTWKQPKHQSTDEWIKNVWDYIFIYIYTRAPTHAHTHIPMPKNDGILLSHKKERNIAICSSMDEFKYYHTAWMCQTNKYDVFCMWNLKRIHKWTYLQNRNRFTEVKSKFMVIKGEGINYEYGIKIYTPL